MPLRNTAQTYGSVAKFLHWAIVLLIVPQYFLAEAAEGLEPGPERLQLFTYHKSFGMLVLMLALLRIVWKVVNRPHPAPIGAAWHRKAAMASHALLYLLILLQPITGWIVSSTGNSPVTLFGWFEFPAIAAANHDRHETFEDVHKVLFKVLLGVATVHIVAALYHHFVLRDDVLRRMLPFARRGQPG